MLPRMLLLTLLLGLPGMTRAASVDNHEKTAALARERLAAAQHAFDLVRKRYQAGQGTAEGFYCWSRRVLDSQKAVDPGQAKVRAALQAHLDRMNELEKIVTARNQAGQLTADEVAAARFYRLEAEIWLAQAKK